MEKVRMVVCALRVHVANLASMALVAGSSAPPAVQTAAVRTAEEVVRFCC